MILLLTEADLVSKEKLSKQNLVGAFGFSNDKIVLILLTKFIVFYIRFLIIHIQGSSLSRPVSRLFRGD